MSPGGSVKDRAALYMINAAERDGHLTKGGALCICCVCKPGMQPEADAFA